MTKLTPYEQGAADAKARREPQFRFNGGAVEKRILGETGYFKWVGVTGNDAADAIDYIHGYEGDEQ